MRVTTTAREATRTLCKLGEDPVARARILERFTDRDHGAEAQPEPPTTEAIFVRTNYIVHALVYSGHGRQEILEQLMPFFAEEAEVLGRPGLVPFGIGVAESVLKGMTTDRESLLIGMRMPTWMVDQMYDDLTTVEVDLPDDPDLDLSQRIHAGDQTSVIR